MSENVSDIRLERAVERGFIPPEATEAQIAIGLEDMHEAPLSSIGKYLLPETVTIVIPESQIP